jgi:hypothetical protein
MNDSAKPMGVADFQQLLATDGIMIEDWSVSARDAAGDLLKRSHEAQLVYKAAIVLDDGLKALALVAPALPVSERLLGCILADADQCMVSYAMVDKPALVGLQVRSRGAVKRAWRGDITRPLVAAGASAAAAVGVWIGYADPVGLVDIVMTTMSNSGGGTGLTALLDSAGFSTVFLNEAEL